MEAVFPGARVAQRYGCVSNAWVVLADALRAPRAVPQVVRTRRRAPWGVPEGDTFFRAAANLRPALAGKELVELEIRRDPRGRRAPEPGVTITTVESSGKHLLVNFSDGQVLHTHMQMTGAWHVYAPGQRWRRPGHTARVILCVADGTSAVCFNAPIVELRRAGDIRERSTRASRMLDRLGPDLCTPDVDLDAVIERLGSLAP